MVYSFCDHNGLALLSAKGDQANQTKEHRPCYGTDVDFPASRRQSRGTDPETASEVVGRGIEMATEDQTKELFEKLLVDLYAKQAVGVSSERRSYLEAQDGQFLGEITRDRNTTNSMLNSYGPYGSRYSETSIFNEYSPYGSPYGQYSVNNPYCATPPRLYINRRMLGLVTKNQYVSGGISTAGFLYALENNLGELLRGNIVQNEGEARRVSGESFIEANDKVFLGSLSPNSLDSDSIFNTFGAYGSRYSQTSIYNSYGHYGGGYSTLSPYNPYTGTPPRVYHKGQFLAYLTVNRTLSPRIDPEEIKDWATRNVSREW